MTTDEVISLFTQETALLGAEKARAKAELSFLPLLRIWFESYLLTPNPHTQKTNQEEIYTNIKNRVPRCGAKDDLKKNSLKKMISCFCFYNENIPGTGRGTESRFLKNCGKQLDVYLFKCFGGRDEAAMGVGRFAFHRVVPSGPVLLLEPSWAAYVG